MTTRDRDEMVDLVAQAVIDRIEERDRINRIADVVIKRIMAIQAEESAALAASEQNVSAQREEMQHAEEQPV